METAIDENPTREKILILLKKSGSMTVEELSRRVGITPMGVRQHITSLEKRGFVSYEAKKHGIGRPVFLYRLTEKAAELFPRAYGKLLITLLDAVEATDGRKKVDALFRHRKEAIFKERRSKMPEGAPLGEKLESLFEILENEGYIAELKESEKNYILRQFNCPIALIAARYKEACKYELQLLRELLGADVARTECIAEGDTSCSFNIPAA